MGRKQNLNALFLHTKPVKILTTLYKKDESERYASIIAKIVDCTYSHTVKILDDFKKAGLIEFKKDGRIKRISLTKKGEELAREFEKLSQKLKE